MTAHSADPAQGNADGDIFGDVCDICPGDVNNDSDGDLASRGKLGFVTTGVYAAACTDLCDAAVVDAILK